MGVQRLRYREATVIAFTSGVTHSRAGLKTLAESLFDLNSVINRIKRMMLRRASQKQRDKSYFMKIQSNPSIFCINYRKTSKSLYTIR